VDALDDSTIDPGSGVMAELLDDLAELVADLPGDRQRQLLDDLKGGDGGDRHGTPKGDCGERAEHLRNGPGGRGAAGDDSPVRER